MWWPHPQTLGYTVIPSSCTVLTLSASCHKAQTCRCYLASQESGHRRRPGCWCGVSTSVSSSLNRCPPLIWPQTDHGRMTVAIIVGFDEVVTVRDYPWLNDGVSIWHPSISFSKEQGKSSHVYLVTSSARGQCTGEKTEGHMWWKHTGTCQSKWNWSPRRPDNLDRMIKAPWLTHQGLGRVGGTWINKKGSRLMGEHLEKVTFVRNRG